MFCEQAADGSLRATLGDLGLAGRADDGKTMAHRCGSAGFVAPEVFRKSWGKWRLDHPERKIEDVELRAAILKTDAYSTTVYYHMLLLMIFRAFQ